MWFDEAARLLIAQAPLEAILTNAGRDTLPPFFHLTLHFWSDLGYQDFWLRLPPAFTGLITIAAVYTLGTTLFSKKTGLISAFIMAVMPYQIFQSQQANLYSYLALFSALLMLFFYLGLSRSRIHWWIGYLVVLTAGMYTHYFTGFVVITLHLWLIFLTLKNRTYLTSWPWLLAADFLAGLAFLPQLAILIRETGVVASDFWLTTPTLVAPLSTMHLFTAGFSLPGNIFPISYLLVTTLIAIISFDLFFHLKRHPELRGRLLLVFMLTFLPHLIVFLIAQFVPIYLERVLIIITPAFCLFLGYAISITHRKSPLPYLAGLTGIIVILSMYGYYFNPDFSKPDYRQAAEFIAAQIEEGQVILHTGNGSYLPFLLYSKPEDHFLLDGDPAPHHPPDLHEIAGGRTVSLQNLAGYDQVWLVTALDHSQAYQGGIITDFDARFPLLLETNVDDIIIREYSLNP
jgi:4-amino-4-deoxy-L-arabinose transferase-like glycosyltransferase